MRAHELRLRTLPGAAAAAVTLGLVAGGCSDEPSPPKPTPSPSEDPPVCASDGIGVVDPACCGGEATLTVTTGDLSQTVAVTEGYEATMIHGPQGGWHIFTGALMTRLRSVVGLDVTVTVPSRGDAIVSFSHYSVGVIVGEGCEGLYPQLRSVLDVSALAEGDLDTPPELLSGEIARVTTVATDSDGHVAEGTALLTLAPDPIDVATPTP